MKLILIRAAFDHDAKVWFVESSDLAGVHAEGATLDELRDKLPAVVQDAIGDGAPDDDVLIEIVAHTSARIGPRAAA
jgi:predicted RNase H-like HicB family nuclease